MYLVQAAYVRRTSDVPLAYQSRICVHMEFHIRLYGVSRRKYVGPMCGYHEAYP